MRFILLGIFLCSVGSLIAQTKKDTVAAHYPGGQGAWTRYLNKHFRLPDDLVPDRSSVRAVFRVSANGKISKVRMISGDPRLRKTFVRLLKNSAPWVPAMADGKPVPSASTFYLNYDVEIDQ